MSFAGIHLKQDGIKEALFEIRFETGMVPEAVIGRLTDAAEWSAFTVSRMPTADIPPQIRMMDPNLRYAPSYELVCTETRETIRIGPSSIALHRGAPYPGWDEFFPSLQRMVSILFQKIDKVMPVRLGFRYVNALNARDQFIGSAADLDLKIVAGSSDELTPPSFALNFRHHNLPGHIEQVQIATPDYVQQFPDMPEFSVLVDIDIFTPEFYNVGTEDVILEWLKTAHERLKENFFKLLPQAVIDRLAEGGH